MGRPDLPPFPGFEGEAFVGDNVIEGNRIEGGFGLGIEIRGSDDNRIANNTIRGIERREPFPGNTANGADPLPWQHANGSGIWVSAGSSRNTIADNEFADIEVAAVVLDGDSTVVQLRSPGDEVRDRGSANRVNRPADASPVASPTGEPDAGMAGRLRAGARSDSVIAWLTARALPIRTTIPGNGFDDLLPLKQAFRDARIIGMGEATHGTREFFQYKHRLFECLVAEMGVRVLAFEGSQSAAEHVVDPYVQGGPVTSRRW